MLEELYMIEEIPTAFATASSYYATPLRRLRRHVATLPLMPLTRRRARAARRLSAATPPPMLTSTPPFTRLAFATKLIAEMRHIRILRCFSQRFRQNRYAAH